MAEKPKYKHTTHFKKADLENITYSVWSPTLRDWRDVIEDYIEISKKRKDNKLAMFKLQIELMGDIVNVNNAIKAYIKLVEDPEHRKQEFPDVENIDKSVEYWEQEIKSNKILLNALKDIGDGIAWRVLNYDRSLVYNMSVNNEDSGPLTLNLGLMTELHSLGDFANDPEVINFVYHGITNFLLISDLTIVYRNGEINFVEVKSGKNPRGKSWKERLKRQEEKAKNIADIGNKSKGESSKVDVEFRLIDKKPKTILDKIDTLIKKVKDKEMVTQVFNSYFGIAIVNYSNTDDQTSVVERFKNLETQIRKSDKDIFISPNSVEGFIFSPNKAPLSVHPFNSEDIANILMGKYMVFYFFNVSQFMREIEKHGWIVSDIIYNRKENNDPSLFSVTKENLTMKVPPLLTSRAIYEGLSVDSMVEIFEDSYRRGASKSGYVFYGFEKEKYLWV